MNEAVETWVVSDHDHPKKIRFSPMSQYDTDIEEGVITKTRDEIDEPSLYKVLLLNDDYTTMDFVVQVLMYVFHKSEADSRRIMLKVHEEGVGLCGVYSFEIAETKVETVHALASERGFPLKCTMERE